MVNKILRLLLCKIRKDQPHAFAFRSMSNNSLPDMARTTKPLWSDFFDALLVLSKDPLPMYAKHLSSNCGRPFLFSTTTSFQHCVSLATSKLSPAAGTSD